MKRQGKAGHVSVGHPVDVATGELFDLWTDSTLPGKIDLTWTRRYSTALLDKPASLLGKGWTANFLATLQKEGNAFVFVDGTGAEIRFEEPQGKIWTGDAIRNLGAFCELKSQGGLFSVTRWIPDSHATEIYQFQAGNPGSLWPVTSILDAFGHAIDIAYDSLGRIQHAVQRRERRGLLFRYNDLGRLSEVEESSAQFRMVRARYGYDQLGRLTRAEVAGCVETYEYDDAHRMVRETTRTGGVFEFKYDAQGRCIRSAGTDRYYERSFRYLSHLGWTEVTDSKGSVWRYQYLPTGQVIETHSPMGRIEKKEYDSESRIVKTVDPEGGAIEYAYSQAGDYATIADPMGRVTAFKHNDRHQLVEFVDTAGGEWSVEYDAAGRMIKTVDALGAQWECIFDGNGDPIAIRDAMGRERRFAYDANGNVLAETDWKGGAHKYAYDVMGRVIQVIDPAGQKSEFARDNRGLVIAVRLPSGGVRKFEYDNAGQLTAFSDENGKTTRYRWGTCGRLIKRTSPNGAKQKYFWSTEPDRLEKVVNESGLEYRFEYDADGRPIKENGFDGTILEREFGMGLQPSLERNSNGEESLFEWDLLGRILKKSLPDGSQVEFGYHPLGAMAFADNGTVRVEFERDAVGRIVKEIQGSHSVQSAYDSVGNRISLQSSLGHAVQFGWTANDELSEVMVNGKWNIRFEYDALGREVRRFLPGGGILAQAFDTLDRMTAQEYQHPTLGMQLPLSQRESGRAHLGGVAASMRIARALTYDASGDAYSIQDAFRGQEEFRLDTDGKLTDVRRSSGRQERFSWDESGNALTWFRQPIYGDKVNASHGEMQCQYGEANRLAARGSTRFEYDGAGRLIRKIQPETGGQDQVWEYGWNGEGWLAWVKTPEGETWKYRYDAFGRRVAKEGPSGTIQFVWDADTLLHEIDAHGRARTWTFDDTFRPLCAVADGDIHLYVNDQSGLPMETIKPDGTISWAASHSAWGLIDAVHANAFDNPIRYLGQYQDHESGLHYNRFRHYDPETGRFISPDPIGTSSDLNAYRYASAPGLWSDPFGLETVTENVGGRTYTFERDSQGRTTRAEGPISNPNRIQNEDRQPSAQRRVSEGTGDHAGHLIGNQFGGPGGDVNLVRMCEPLNLGKWKVMENKLVKLSKNNRVSVVVNVHYDGNNPKPSKFTVTATVTDRKGNVTTKRWLHQNC